MRFDFELTKISDLDGAPCHKAAKALAHFADWLPEENLISQRTGRYINDKQMFWAPSSPDLNPLDYAIWAAMKKFLLRDLGVKNQQVLENGLRIFFDTHQDLITNAIQGSVKGYVPVNSIQLLVIGVFQVYFSICELEYYSSLHFCRGVLDKTYSAHVILFRLIIWVGYI